MLLVSIDNVRHLKIGLGLANLQILENPDNPTVTGSDNFINKTVLFLFILNIILICRRMFSCQELFCFTLIPCVILSLVAIGVSSMLIYIHLMQQYQEKILKLQVKTKKVSGFYGSLNWIPEFFDLFINYL